jgi:hypothetical protein
MEVGYPAAYCHGKRRLIYSLRKAITGLVRAARRAAGSTAAAAANMSIVAGALTLSASK